MEEKERRQDLKELQPGSNQVYKNTLQESVWVSCFKAFIVVCAFCVVCMGLYAGWTTHQMNTFRNNVQSLRDRGKGMETLRMIDDWRVDDITETTKRVSRADGHYVLLVWYLPSGRYLVEAVEK